MGAAPRRAGRVVGVLTTTLLVFPLLAIPLYLVGHFLADAVDNDDSNGIFGLSLILGIAGPGLLAILAAS